MINVGHFEEIERRIPTASAEELVNIRSSTLRDAEYAESQLLKCPAGGKIPWQEDLGFAYMKNMQIVAACSLRLAQLYSDLEDEEG